jgi:hypothetical protein
MKINEFITEMSGTIDTSIREILEKKGYKYLDGGIDKDAYLEPKTGQVLVIFGYHKDARSGFSDDQMMFVDWAKYCQKNSNNPHLPKFSGWESFKHKGRTYLQIRMEPLKEVSFELRKILAYLDNYIEAKGKIKRKQVAKQLGQHPSVRIGLNIDKTDPDDILDPIKAKEIINYLGGKESAMSLMRTVQIAKHMAEKNGYRLDLHGSNYMQRPNGTIVVNDPFVLTFHS